MMDRLTSASLAAGQSQSFTYDGAGNRFTGVVNGASTAYTYPGTSHRTLTPALSQGRGRPTVLVS
jgi:YD repeat-containing protein